MMSCRLVRRSLLELTRQTASDELRLQVESHLEECAACTEEAARWKLVGLVKRYEAPGLNALAQRRILERLMTVAASPARVVSSDRQLRRQVRRRSILIALPVAAMEAALVLVVGLRHRPHTVAEGEMLDAVEAG